MKPIIGARLLSARQRSNRSSACVRNRFNSAIANSDSGSRSLSVMPGSLRHAQSFQVFPGIQPGVMTVSPERLQRVIAHQFDIIDGVGSGRRQRKYILRIALAAHVFVSAPAFDTRASFAQIVQRIMALIAIRPLDDQLSAGLIQRDPGWAWVIRLVHGWYTSTSLKATSMPAPDSAAAPAPILPALKLSSLRLALVCWLLLMHLSPFQVDFCFFGPFGHNTSGSPFTKNLNVLPCPTTRS